MYVKSGVPALSGCSHHETSFFSCTDSTFETISFSFKWKTVLHQGSFTTCDCNSSLCYVKLGSWTIFVEGWDGSVGAVFSPDIKEKLIHIVVNIIL